MWRRAALAAGTKLCDSARFARTDFAHLPCDGWPSQLRAFAVNPMENTARGVDFSCQNLFCHKLVGRLNEYRT